ncbi:rifin, partial [Plasmodium reichenowi]
RDKNIQEIIEKDKMEKSLADKVEKGCLRCGCGLGGVAASVGIFGTVAVKELTKASMIAATDAGIKKGIEVGFLKVTEIVKQSLHFETSPKLPTIEVLQEITAGKFNDEVTLYGIFECINSNMKGELYDTYQQFSTTVKTMVAKTPIKFNKDYHTQAEAVSAAFSKAKEGILADGAIKTSSLNTGITASVVAIVVIVLIMLIIYLILRYRRKKKMKKKAQYTKLLNQ